MKIYLAGAFSGWRDSVIEGAPDHEYYDPRKDTDQTAICRFTLGDQEGVESCEMLFCYDEEGHENIGMSWEIGVASANRIPIILCTTKKFIFPIHAGAALRIMTDLDTALFYLNALSETHNELKAAYATLKR